MLERLGLDGFMIKMRIVDGSRAHVHLLSTLPASLYEGFRSADKDDADPACRHVNRQGTCFAPYSLACAVMKASITGTAIPGSIYLLIAANSAAYLTPGLLLFTRLEKRPRRLGVLGDW